MPPLPTPILRFVHLDNLDTLIRRGGLHSPNSVPKDKLPYLNTHSAEVQAKRATKAIPCGPRGTIHDYVPFYFGYLSPMMLNLKTGRVAGYNQGQEPLIYCLANAQGVQAAGLKFVFSDGHGLAQLTEWHDDLSQLDQVDWNMVNERYWKDSLDDPDRQRRKQAEFLIHAVCPWSLIERIVVIDQTIKSRVEKVFSNFAVTEHRPVIIDRAWYYH